MQQSFRKDWLAARSSVVCRRVADLRCSSKHCHNQRRHIIADVVQNLGSAKCLYIYGSKKPNPGFEMMTAVMVVMVLRWFAITAMVLMGANTLWWPKIVPLRNYVTQGRVDIIQHKMYTVVLCREDIVQTL